MSSTTGAVRVDGDKYYTPKRLARSIVDWISADFFVGAGPATILEPSVGGGAFVEACRNVWPDAELCGVDLDPEAPGLELVDDRAVESFENHTPRYRFDLVVGNPPFAFAEEHARKAYALTRSGGIVALLLRSGFFHGKKRAAFWDDHPPWMEYRLVERPSFTEGGTDSAEYSVFIWTPGRRVAFCRTERRSWK